MSGRIGLCFGFAAMAIVSSAAHADVVQSLSTLMGEPSVTVGNATYSNFHLPGGTIAASDILATITGSVGSPSSITFSVNGGTWNANNSNFLANDASVITFDVSFTTPVTTVGLSFVAQASGGVAAGVGETVTDPALPDNLKDLPVQVFINGTGADKYSQTVPLNAPSTFLHVLKSIDIYGATGTSSITSVTNTYSVPEPASLGVLSLGAVALLRRRRDC